MKVSKTLISFLTLAFLFSLNVKAAELTPNGHEPSSISKQVQAYLSGLDLGKLDEDKTVLVDFILNSKGEMMILSTNSKELDSALKARLNYKVLQSHKLNLNKTYTIPLKFNKS